MKDWMGALASQYRSFRALYPEEQLAIVFDIDGTILDMRFQICHVLFAYDRAHGTKHFYGVSEDDIIVHENQVDRFLATRPLTAEQRAEIRAWYEAHLWSSEAMLAAHEPFRGVLDVIRWFQIQPRTVVALNTGRAESLREDTLRSLNALGDEYSIQFDSELLYMNPLETEENTPHYKSEGLDHFAKMGYRVFAVVDNEPDNIAHMAAADRNEEVLFLHADTFFESPLSPTPRTVSGRTYDIRALVRNPEDLPPRVQLVWHGVAEPASFAQFLRSPVHWGEGRVRLNPHGQPVFRRLPFRKQPWRLDEEPLPLEAGVTRVREAGKGLKMDLKGDAALVDEVCARLERLDDLPEDLWFGGAIQRIGEAGVRRLAAAFPDAILQLNVDFIAPLVLGLPDKAHEVLELLQSWGANRFSLRWRTESKRPVVQRISDWGFEVNLYDVPNLEAFLQAALMLPTSLSSNFAFPDWPEAGERFVRRP